MLLIIGALIVLASVGGGYVLSHGYLPMLWQPYELIIICGAAFGAFVIANGKHTIIEVMKSAPKLIAGSGFNRAFYMDLLSLM
ncbi:motility-associated protein, partial [Oceanospirillum sp. HFRX-1_2]